MNKIRLKVDWFFKDYSLFNVFILYLFFLYSKGIKQTGNWIGCLRHRLSDVSSETWKFNISLVSEVFKEQNCKHFVIFNVNIMHSVGVLCFKPNIKEYISYRNKTSSRLFTWFQLFTSVWYCEAKDQTLSHKEEFWNV